MIFWFSTMLKTEEGRTSRRKKRGREVVREGGSSGRNDFMGLILSKLLTF